jgi:hypothetical protein
MPRQYRPKNKALLSASLSIPGTAVVYSYDDSTPRHSISIGIDPLAYLSMYYTHSNVLFFLKLPTNQKQVDSQDRRQRDTEY